MSVPHIRFKRFVSAWQKRTMLQCSSKIGDGLHGTPKYADNTGIYFINGNNLVSGSILITNETKQVSMDEKSKNDDSLDFNTLLLSINGTIGNLAWYQGQNVMLGKSVAFIKLENCANGYMYFYLQTERIKNYFLNSLTGSTIKNLGLKAIRESTVVIPEEHIEQTEIGNYFQKLDNLINQHQQKHDKLSNIKKAMLEKMFPKQGETVPEIRFKGFGGEWEERTLGGLCLIGDIDHRMPESKTSGIPYLMTGDFTGINGLDFENAKLISHEDYEQLSKKIKPESGDIIFARYASVGAVRYVETEIKFLVSYSCAILKTSNKSYGRYLFYRLQTGRSQNQIELDVNTGSQRNIGIDSLKNMTMNLPSPNEQTRIGNFFQKLDTLINQHQQQLTKLNNIKQACLSKMFV